jgi:hypothetical protein
MSLTNDILGVTDGIKARLATFIPALRSAPISVQTSGGTEAVYQPPTIAPPPSAVNAVMQQLGVSVPLQENTVTGAGTGSGRNSLPITASIPGTGSYILLAGLALVLLVAYAYDKGKL